MKLPKFIKSHQNKENEGGVKLRNILTSNQLSLTNDYKFQPQKPKQQSNYYGVADASFVLVKSTADTAFINFDDKASAPTTPAQVTISPSMASKLFNFKPLGGGGVGGSVKDVFATPKQLNIAKDNLDRLNKSSGRYSKSAQCKRLQRNRLQPASVKPSNYMLRSAVLSQARTSDFPGATPVRPFNHLAKSSDQVDSRVAQPTYHECLSDSFLNECRGNLSNDMPTTGRILEPAIKASPRTPSQTPKSNGPPQVTQSAAPLTRFEKLSKFVSRSALKVVSNVASVSSGSSSSKSKSNLFANRAASKTPGSNGSSPSTSMHSDDEDDELNSNVIGEDQRSPAPQQPEQAQENNYFQYDQLSAHRSTSSVSCQFTATGGFKSFESSSAKPRRPTMGITALSLRQMKQSSSHQNITTAGMNMLPNIYLVSVPIVFNSTDLLSNEEYMSTCSSFSSKSSASSSSNSSSACYNHLSRGNSTQPAAQSTGYLVPQTPRRDQLKTSLPATPAKFVMPTPSQLPATPMRPPPPLPPNASTGKMSIYNKQRETSRANETYDTINDSVF